MQSLNGSSSRPEMDRTGSLLSELSVEKEKHPSNSDDTTSTLLESQETESESTQWTDEKHSLYLNSMEASFVNQLYDSLDTLGGFSQQESLSEPKNWGQMNDGVATPSGQFKVFKDGSWARVNFSNYRREMARPKQAQKSDPVFANPWIQHYRSSCRHQTRTFQGQAPVSTTANPTAFPFGCQDSMGSNTEMTDQNFADEDSEEEKKSRKRRQKCRKMSAATASSNDQVVPHGKLSLIDDHSKVHSSQKECKPQTQC
ncbi:cold-regulated protein 27 isoform X1 [Coffea arabica]